jgi:hypothetical protein
VPNATTPVEVCNRALACVGVTTFIDDLGEDSKEAGLCTRFFEDVRDEVLESFEWPFASRRAALAVSTETRDGWGYVYVAPDDCLVPRRIDDGNTNRLQGLDTRIPFNVEADDSGDELLILTDQVNAGLVYTRQHTNVAVWPRQFLNAVAWRLAAELVIPLQLKPEVRKAAMGEYAQAVASARSTWLMVGQKDKDVPSVFVTRRR